eukprot:TRINITY_DN1551_c0_g1_i1.p1 TRINITY_DN1551_c0_g1~~TRINITY_DN1551_c0_g1_i1.p1  ORF type:complete len:156 (-),score=47.98 TRINITY_DN1551_c0_g1_i1:31-498(-)
MAKNFTEKQKEEYQLAFNMFDTDGSGKISTTELGQVLAAVGVQLPEESVQQIIFQFDKNGDGELNFGEFLDLMASTVSTSETSEEQQIKEWRAAFNLVDTDGSGKISTTELGTLMKNLGVELSQEQLKLVISQYDTSGSGELDFHDFCSLLKSAK